ncbi:hypothetical protein PML80_06030 [Aerococcus urinaeequi]|uniref:Uncharacterized protein n=1 Tax=Aerococcus urinaeequi TaxID=51665 RepID=A0AAF0BIG7_9LACT|nr:hypothetical protein [Aerococcus urinaeequi]WCG37082.1 hypothetical protein PML80_06030 [Aerococcus urinaeequi]
MVWVIIVVVGVIISILMAIGDILGNQRERDAHLSTIKLRQMKEQEMAQQSQQQQQQNAKTDNDARISELEKEKRILELEKQIEELKK